MLRQILVSGAVLCGATLSAAALEPGEENISAVLASGVAAPTMAPVRGDESRGPFPRLLLRNGFLIDGTGAPPRGPVDILILNNRIAEIRNAGKGAAANATAPDGTEVIDASGKYILPGFIDAHAHLGSTSHAPAGSLTDPEYVLKLWLAHGITTVRDVGATMGLKWTLQHRELSAKGSIAAPHLVVFAALPATIASPEQARAWVRDVHRKGADGVKFFGAAPAIIAAATAEARDRGMRTAFHHAQLAVTRVNVLDSARMGVNSMEHWYGLPEAMFEDRRIQNYPHDYNYSNEQDRFGEAGRLWQQTAAPGSDVWRATIDELISLDFTLSPTFTIYEANRDLMRARLAEWHTSYTMPYMMRAFEPSPEIHGSYFFDWTTADEIAWKENFSLWMQFVNDYKNAGGRVTAGSDAGFIYKIYGFAYIRELELLQEAGFHPLEVIQSATLKGAELLGVNSDRGTVELGKRADLVIVDENPLANFKILYGTGHQRLNRERGAVEIAGGIRYTIKDGIVFDAQALLADVRELVAQRKMEEAALGQ